MISSNVNFVIADEMKGKNLLSMMSVSYDSGCLNIQSENEKALVTFNFDYAGIIYQKEYALKNGKLHKILNLFLSQLSDFIFDYSKEIYKEKDLLDFAKSELEELKYNLKSYYLG